MNDAIVVDEATGEVVQGLARHGAMLFDKRGLDLKEETDYDEWIEVGASLSQANKKLWWYIGDWWRFGSRKWGEGKAHAESAGLEYKSCRNAAVISGAFELSRRRDKVSWSAHAEVAVLPVPEQDRILDEAPTKAQARKAAREYRHSIETKTVALPVGLYSLIYCDPPWRYEHVETESRAIENHYPTMELDEIKALPVPAADDCVLFMWATSPKLAESIDVINSWGFSYRTCAVWVKDKIGMGYYFRQRHEVLLVATKGTPGTPEPSDRIDSVIESPRNVHSAKPLHVYGILESMYPKAQRIELFARNQRDGWDSWGNQSGE